MIKKWNTNVNEAFPLSSLNIGTFSLKHMLVLKDFGNISLWNNYIWFAPSIITRGNRPTYSAVCSTCLHIHLCTKHYPLICLHGGFAEINYSIVWRHLNRHTSDKPRFPESEIYGKTASLCQEENGTTFLENF